MEIKAPCGTYKLEYICGPKINHKTNRSHSLRRANTPGPGKCEKIQVGLVEYDLYSGRNERTLRHPM